MVETCLSREALHLGLINKDNAIVSPFESIRKR